MKSLRDCQPGTPPEFRWDMEPPAPGDRAFLRGDEMCLSEHLVPLCDFGEDGLRIRFRRSGARRRGNQVLASPRRVQDTVSTEIQTRRRQRHLRLDATTSTSQADVGISLVSPPATSRRRYRWSAPDNLQNRCDRHGLDIRRRRIRARVFSSVIAPHRMGLARIVRWGSPQAEVTKTRSRRRNGCRAVGRQHRSSTELSGRRPIRTCRLVRRAVERLAE